MTSLNEWPIGADSGPAYFKLSTKIKSAGATGAGVTRFLIHEKIYFTGRKKISILLKDPRGKIFLYIRHLHPSP